MTLRPVAPARLRANVSIEMPMPVTFPPVGVMFVRVPQLDVGGVPAAAARARSQSPACTFNFGPELAVGRDEPARTRAAPGLPMRHHLESIFEQRLQPKHVLLRSRQHPFLIEVGVGRLRDDVEAIGVHPVRSADHLIGLQIEGVADEVARRLVRAVEPPAGPGTDATRPTHPICSGERSRPRTAAWDRHS